MGDLLFFTDDSLVPPPYRTWRDWAAATVTDYRKRHNRPQTSDGTAVLVSVGAVAENATAPAAASALRPTRAELTPPLQSPEERRQGNTRNARMARLLRPR